MMQRICYKTCRKQIYNKFSERKSILRNQLQVEVKRYRNEISRNLLKYRVGGLWNSICNTLKSEENITSFKNKIKEHKAKISQHSKRHALLVVRTEVSGAIVIVVSFNHFIPILPFILKKM